MDGRSARIHPDFDFVKIRLCQLKLQFRNLFGSRQLPRGILQLENLLRNLVPCGLNFSGCATRISVGRVGVGMLGRVEERESNDHPHRSIVALE